MKNEYNIKKCLFVSNSHFKIKTDVVSDIEIGKDRIVLNDQEFIRYETIGLFKSVNDNVINLYVFSKVCSDTNQLIPCDDLVKVVIVFEKPVSIKFIDEVIDTIKLYKKNGGAFDKSTRSYKSFSRLYTNGKNIGKVSRSSTRHG
jgi:hypothetical protein